MRNVESLLITQTFSSQVSQNSRGFCKQNISRQPPAAEKRKGWLRDKELNQIKSISYIFLQCCQLRMNTRTFVWILIELLNTVKQLWTLVSSPTKEQTRYVKGRL